MAASRYRQFIRLIEEWPIDSSKKGRDLAAHIRQRVAKEFSRGENTKTAPNMSNNSSPPRNPDGQMVRVLDCKVNGSWIDSHFYPDFKQPEERKRYKIDEKTCDREYDALMRIHTDFYRKKVQYPRMHDTSATGSSAEDCHRVMASENIDEINELNKSVWTRLKESISGNKEGTS